MAKLTYNEVTRIIHNTLTGRESEIITAKAHEFMEMNMAQYVYEVEQSIPHNMSDIAYDKGFVTHAQLAAASYVNSTFLQNNYTTYAYVSSELSKLKNVLTSEYRAADNEVITGYQKADEAIISSYNLADTQLEANYKAADVLINDKIDGINEVLDSYSIASDDEIFSVIN